MFEPNVQRLLGMVGDRDQILDIGGWACPFNRATHILDAGPYETRGFYAQYGGLAFQGGKKEHFTKETWVQRDICAREPYPFRDQQFDFVTCSHTLEDLRDPIWVCSEIQRIGKRGYIEIPSRLAETSRGWEHPRLAGLSHHRWLIDIDRNHIRFLHKPHMIHSHWRFSFPRDFFLRQEPDKKVQWLFWDRDFSVEETVIYGLKETAQELERYVQSVRPYSEGRLATARLLLKTQAFADRVRNGIKRRLIPSKH